MQILRRSETAVTMEVYIPRASSETRRAPRKLGKALGGSKQKDGKKKSKRKQEERPDEDGRQAP